MASYGAPRTPEAPFLNSAKGDESHSYSSPMPMVLDNSRSRSPRQHYVWSEKALSIVRSTRIPKKYGAMVVQQLQALTGYPEKPCWRLAERFGMKGVSTESKTPKRTVTQPSFGGLELNHAPGDTNQWRHECGR